MFMIRNLGWLFHLLDLGLKRISRLTIVQPYQQAAILQHPLSGPADRGEWRAYWKDHKQAWRTEPEIDRKRQQDLERQLATIPEERVLDMEEVLFFKDIQLSRAD